MRISFSLLLILFSLSGYTQETDNSNLMVHDPYVRPSPPGIVNSAGYFHLMNKTDSDIILTDADSDVAARTEIHEHTMIDGNMKMQKVSSLTIPAKTTITFQPGGYHIMLMELKQPIKVGDKIALTLIFSDGSSQQVTAIAKEPSSHSQHHHKGSAY